MDSGKPIAKTVTSTPDDGLLGAVPPAATLGDVLYADGAPADEALSERDWIVLVNYVAAGNQRALRQLYERTHRLVFSLIARITNSREVAENLTIEVFSDLSTVRYARDQAEHQTMRTFVELPQDRKSVV